MPEFEPLLAELPPGEYWCCRCGKSASGAFCDGSHHRLNSESELLDQQQEKRPKQRPEQRLGRQPKPQPGQQMLLPVKLRVTAKTGSVWLCTCAATKTPPFCDGSHNKLPP